MREQLPCSRAHTAAELLMADCSSWSLCLAWAGSVLLACWARDGLQAPSPSGPCLLPGCAPWAACPAQARVAEMLAHASSAAERAARPFSAPTSAPLQTSFLSSNFFTKKIKILILN